MKKSLILSSLLIVIIACNQKKIIDVCQTWPPDDSIGLVLKNDTTDSLSYYSEAQMQGMHGVNKYFQLDNPMDENDLKKMYEEEGTTPDFNKIIENCFKIKGYFYSQLGEIKVKASFNNWTKLNNPMGVYIERWGVELDSGLLIINNEELSAITNDFKYNNQYSIGEKNSKYCLINIKRQNKNRILLIYGFYENGSSFLKPVINSIGTTAKKNQCSFEVKSDGWYSNDINLSKKPFE